MTWWQILLIVVASVVGMELFAWWAHKYIMHGWGWGWHRDHHEPHDKELEKNDLFAVVFGSIVFAMFAAGYYVSDALWWTAFGITLYGLIYTLVHDGLVHQRLLEMDAEARLREAAGAGAQAASCDDRQGRRRQLRLRLRARSGEAESGPETPERRRHRHSANSAGA